MLSDPPESPAYSARFCYSLEEARILSGHTPPDYLEDTSAEEQQRLRDTGAILQLLELDRQIAAKESAGVLPLPALDHCLHSIGGFHIERELGRGGYGIVYLARDARLKRQVALKIPRTNSLFSPDERRRFLREAQAAADLEHAHLVPIYEVGEEGPYCFIVSRFCSAGSLAEFLEASGPPASFRVAANLVAQIADAVEYMHGRGLLHRDIKPSNILLEGALNGSLSRDEKPSLDLEKLHPRLADFGLVKRVDNDSQAPISESLGSHGALGTPAYMAPEQAQNGPIPLDRRADVYSLGALLYELLIGRPPFEGTSIIEILQKVLTCPPAPMRPLRKDLPRDLETICLKCLAKEPHQRYQSAASLAADLRRFLAGDPILGRRPGLLRRTWKWARRKPMFPIAGGLSLILVCSLAYFAVVIAMRDRAERNRIRGAEYLGLIHQVDEGLRTGKRAGINDLLNKLRPTHREDDLRGFEWYYLWQEMWNQGPQWLIGRAGGCRFSHNGSIFAAVGFGACVIRDSVTGNLLATYPLPIESYGPFALSTTDKYLAFVSGIDGNHRIHILDICNGCEVWSKDMGSHDVYAAQVALDDRTIVVIDHNQISEFQLKDSIALGTCFHKPDYPQKILGGAVSGDGSLVVVVTDTELKWWDRTAKRRIGIRKTTGNLHSHIAISPNKESIAFSNTREISVISSLDGHLISKFCVDRDDSFELAFSQTGRFLLSVAPTYNKKTTGEAIVWSIATGQPLLTVSEQNLIQAAFSSDESTVAVETSLGDQFAIQFVRFGTRIPRSVLSGNHVEAWAVAFGPEKQLLASGGDDGNVRLWNTKSGNQSLVLPHGSLVAAIAFSPDGKTLATGCDDNKVRFWDPASGELLGDFSSLSAPARFLAFSPDGRFLAIGERSENITVLDARSGKVSFRCMTTSDHVKGLCFSSDSAILYSGDDNGFLSFWSVPRQKLQHQLLTHSRIRRICRSPAGAMMATAHADGSVVLRNADNGTEVHSLRGHQEQVLAIAFDLNGRTLASAGSDHSVILWRCDDGQQLMRLTGPVLQINDLAFSRDGRTLAAACHDGNVYLWRGADDDSRAPSFERTDSAPTSNLDFSARQDILLSAAPACLARGMLGNGGREKLVVSCPELRQLFEIVPGSSTGSKLIQSRPLPPNSTAFVLGDFNKNGDVDLAVADPERRSIDVHWSRGGDAFDRVDSTGDGQLHGFLVSADLNNDGQLDLLAANPQTHSVSVYLSQRPDRLDPVSRVVTGKGPCHISMADLNRDGYLDLIVAESGENAVSVHLGKGNGTFSAGTILEGLKRPVATAIGDFNNDGKLDIAVVQENGESVTIFVNKGVGQFVRSHDLPVGPGCCSIIATDLDNDGSVDLAVVNPITSTLGILHNRGDGTFDAAKHYPTGKGPISLLAGDFNQDGVIDLAICCKEGKLVALHYGKKLK